MIRLRAGALALGLLLLLAGCSGAAPEQVAQQPAPPPLDPASISIPSIGAQSSLIPLGIDTNGGWAIPPLDRPEQASWYSPGVAPGSIGRAVILGHVNGCARGLTPQGTCVDGAHRDGVFADLDKMAAGQQFTVTGRDGRVVTFRVTDVDRIPKEGFPTAQVLGESDRAELRLITCGGAFDADARRYLDNILVTAEAV